VPRLCEFCPGIYLTTEEKARKNLSEGKKNLSLGTVYILPKHLHITKQTHRLTLTPTPPTHTHTHTYTHAHTTDTHPQITKQCNNVSIAPGNLCLSTRCLGVVTFKPRSSCSEEASKTLKEYAGFT